jgi:hypothetical protein
MKKVSILRKVKRRRMETQIFHHAKIIIFKKIPFKKIKIKTKILQDIIN